MASTDLAVVEPGGFLALAKDPGEVSGILADSLLGEELDPFSLPRIKFPSAGSTTWEVPTASGSEPMKALTGVIVHIQLTRTLWASNDITGEPPKCRSTGPKATGVGTGDPGGKCASCPMLEWGSGVGKNGEARGKACNERMIWFMLLEQSGYLPHVLQLPTMSVDPGKQYLQNTLGNYGIRRTSVVTEITLRPEKNSSGEPYAVIVPRNAGALDPAEAEHAAAYAAAMGGQLDAAAAAISGEPAAGASGTGE